MRKGIDLIIAAALLLAQGAALAGEGGAGEDEDRIELDPLVIVASKSPRPLSEVAAQVTVIDSEDIRAALVEDLDGLLRYQPGLELETAGTRFGATSINLRGIGGNRVSIELDGVPARDRFAIGAFSNGGRALVEPDRIKRVEVLYGPASVMYGSDALGGVVAVSTWDPSDLLARTDSAAWGGLRGGYQGANESWVGSGIAAWGEGAHGLLAAATYRDGKERDNQAPSEVPDDPQRWESRDFMFRYTFDTAAGNRLRVTAAAAEIEATTMIGSLLGYGRQFRNTTELIGDDQDEGRRLSLDYSFSFGDWRQGVVRVFDFSHDTDQLTREERAAAAHPVELVRRFLYEQDRSGVELNLFRDASWGGSRHRIGIGLEWLRTEVKELRDGLQTSLVDGSTTKVILGEELPVRDFPNSRTDAYSVFAQDEISLAEGRWEIIPGLRWDRYDLDPEPDSLWLEDHSETGVVSVSENEFTPRLGLVFNPGNAWSMYGQYVRGFRAPPVEDVNIGLNLPLFNVRAIPNPSLESETSDGFEIGARRLRPGSRFSMAAFHTDYEDFIESKALIGRDPETGELLFQSRNIDKARIRGVDIRLDQELDAWIGGPGGWLLSLAAYWAEGDNRENGQPLNSIAPPQAVLGLSWVSGDGVWDFGAAGTFTAAKDESDIDQTDEARFATSSWVTVDLTAGWRAGEWLELRAGIFNLTDEAYWRWLDAANLAADDPMIPLLSRPGRSYSITAQLSF